MKTSKYWIRFMAKIREEYNVKFPKFYFAQFEKDGKKFRVELKIYEAPK
jgi:hypothetical protein